MRGLNPNHYRALLPKSKAKAPESSNGAGKKAETSKKKGKAPAYPEQTGGILKKDSKFSGAAKGKAKPDSPEAGTSNPKNVKINPEPEVREFGPLQDLFSPRGTDQERRLLRTESMPADLAAARAAYDGEPLALPPRQKAQAEAGPSAPPSSPQSPSSPRADAGAGNPAPRMPALDRYLADQGAVPMTLSDYLERPLTPSTLSPSDSFLNSPNRMFPSREPSFEIPNSEPSRASTPERPGPFGGWESPAGSPASSPRGQAPSDGSLAGEVQIPGTPDGAGSPAHRPGRFPGWESREGSPRLSLPEPPDHLRAAWSETSSGSPARSQGGSSAGGPGSPAHRPGRFPGWESRENTPPGSPATGNRPAIPEPPAGLRAGWTDSSSGSSDGGSGGSVSGESGTPAHRPDRFPGWESRDGSPAATPRQEGQPPLTRTASEVGALFGAEGGESAAPAGHAPAAPATAPAAGEAKPNAPGGSRSTAIGGVALGLGLAGMATAAIVLGGSKGGEDSGGE